MKKLISVSVAAAVAASVSFASSTDDLRAELEALKKEVAALKKQTKGLKAKKLKKQISELKSAALNDNIKWNVDFRTAYDVIGYKYSDGTSDWNQIMTNRLWLGMGYAPTSNITFKGLLSYYKAYGQMTNTFGANFNYFDWIVNETPNPNGELRVKEAYWLYFGDDFFGADIPWTASIGRRPATDGLLVNFRDDQNAKSPIGHIINTEFDGASFKFDLSNVTDVSGMYFKICLGRGMTNANIRYASITPAFIYGTANISQADLAISGTGAEYTKVDDVDHTDLAGFIFVPYDDGQYSVHTTAFKAFSLPGIKFTGYMDLNGNSSQDPTEPLAANFQQVGDLYGAAVSFLAQGIGDGISDMLDETNAFVSFAWSKTDPKSNTQMLGMYVDGNGDGVPETLLGADFGESKTGTSIYAGLNWPCQLIDDARVGVEYNHGSKYWRSFTYAEDTLAGSKLAARGDAYEIWFNKDLIGKILTAQVRYTYIDYKYTGSNGFFANAGTPLTIDEAEAMGMTTVDKAQDIRFYLRYRY
ncbi:DUF3373 family protein [Hydrogenimonas thermophila]|uniref:DUF3373 family protein n=1 Tax=Hydrogenimonas thermophila TaxID=223786 RepID=UPI0029370796|nr:DUF3373 family protein [Hydrogenimonas thermophila]WOE70014.1 DUF3373 family protein [Hydrogenimonas thermophila]WOE72531.1 DUF3373 family protein [Hydrogenimonas thermophila]